LIVDVALNPRVAQILGRIEETRRLAHDHPEGHVARVALEARIEGFYAELGRYVHWLVRQDPAALARLAEEGRRWADDLGRDLRTELIPEVSSAEVEIDELPEDESVEMSASEMPMVELTGDSRVDAVDVRDLVDVEAEPIEEEPATEPEEVAFDDELEPVDDATDRSGGGDVEERQISVRTGSFEVPETVVGGAADVPKEAAPAARAHDDGEWTGPLRDLLAVLGPPEALGDDRAVRAACVRSIAVATTNLEVRWAVFPPAVQQALLGLVGARARRLDEALASDPDVRLAMSRMRRYAESRGLGMVPALREGGGLARNWAADERRYWAVLHAGA
jgi:hypothetical protein